LEEKRKIKRSLCYLKAIKKETGDHIGHVGDIHHEGLNLISEDKIPLEDDLHIYIETPGEEIKIPLIVKGIWNQINEEPKHYITGCQIINPSSESAKAIYELIESLKMGGRNPFIYHSTMNRKRALA
jgi:hypothetical protein